jgi:hypothetical protein
VVCEQHRNRKACEQQKARKIFWLARGACLHHSIESAEADGIAQSVLIVKRFDIGLQNKFYKFIS